MPVPEPVDALCVDALESITPAEVVVPDAIVSAGIFMGASIGGSSTLVGSGVGSGVFMAGTVILSLPGSSAAFGGSGRLLPPPPPPPGPG